MKFNKLAINNPADLIFGRCPTPVTTARGLVIGGGLVYPELNFTVPVGTVLDRAHLPDVKEMYKNIAEGALKRALELESPGVVLEFETLLEMTMDPYIGIELVKVMNEVCEKYYSKYDLKSEIRLTPNDTRDFDRPPLMRTSRHLDQMWELFDKGSQAGGDLLSIESTGGKEVCDEALMECDIQRVIFSQAVLGVRDMNFVWSNIAYIARKNGKIMGGDTACGFGNTAMVLSEKKYIPKSFAAIVHLATIVRSLVAIEQGAIGPDKDCGYEGIFLKAIAGIPISMEGKTAACAHLSPVGNIAAAACDLWSNESVQDIKLLAGMAPTCYLEQLEYDCRLMNTATKKGPETATVLRDLFTNSDVYTDPQALILSPESAIEISKAVVSGENYLDATVKGCLKGLDIIEGAIENGKLKCPDREEIWLKSMREDIEEIPSDEGEFIDDMLEELDDRSKFVPSEYGL